MRALFVADAHLPRGDDPRARAFAALLRREAAPGATLFVLGDVFDAWCGAAGPGTRPRSPALDAILAWGRGVGAVEWLEGNHDFHLAPALAGEPGVAVHPGPVDVLLDGVKVHLAHGDQVNPADRGYQALRRLLRSAPFRAAARAAGPSAAVALGTRLSRASRDGGRGGHLDWEGAVAAWAYRRGLAGSRLAVVGHGHRLGLVPGEGGGAALMQLGEWWEARSYGRWEDGVATLLRIGRAGEEVAVARLDLRGGAGQVRGMS